MGTKSRSILGKISGTIGPAVFSTWRGLEVIKSLPGKRKKRNTKLLQKGRIQTSKFKVVRKFLSFGCEQAIKIGFQIPKKVNMTANNAATSYHLLNAVTGEYPDWQIDLLKVKFSSPVQATDNGWNAVCFLDEMGNVLVNWALNPFPQKTTQLDDEAVIVFYDETKKKFFVINNGVQRQSMTYVWSLNLAKQGHVVHCWLFFVSADRKHVSETAYLGVIGMKI